MTLEDQVRFDGERNVTEKVAVEVDVAVTIVENVLEEDSSSGKSNMQRTRKRLSWLKDYVV